MTYSFCQRWINRVLGRNKVIPISDEILENLNLPTENPIPLGNATWEGRVKLWKANVALEGMVPDLPCTIDVLNPDTNEVMFSMHLHKREDA